MTPPTTTPVARLRRLLRIASPIAFMIAAILIVAELVGRRERAPLHPRVVPTASPPEPIPSEALVFRIRPGDLAVPSETARRGVAHPRTLSMYRSVRAYPGAPPRIAHGLTDEEFRSASCNSCHERGGFVPRFGLYAPVTPHPEYSECLQCHVPDADLVGAPRPDGTPGGLCLQCHRLEDRTPLFVASDWRVPAWPGLGGRAMEGSPPWIPHDLQLRGNCLACHGGPGAVEEIRTTHPERTSCRQCHVPAPSDEDLFTRPLDGSRGLAEGS